MKFKQGDEVRITDEFYTHQNVGTIVDYSINKYLVRLHGIEYFGQTVWVSDSYLESTNDQTR